MSFGGVAFFTAAGYTLQNLKKEIWKIKKICPVLGLWGSSQTRSAVTTTSLVRCEAGSMLVNNKAG